MKNLAVAQDLYRDKTQQRSPVQCLPTVNPCLPRRVWIPCNLACSLLSNHDTLPFDFGAREYSSYSRRLRAGIAVGAIFSFRFAPGCAILALVVRAQSRRLFGNLAV